MEATWSLQIARTTCRKNVNARRHAVGSIASRGLLARMDTGGRLQANGWCPMILTQHPTRHAI